MLYAFVIMMASPDAPFWSALETSPLERTVSPTWTTEGVSDFIIVNPWNWAWTFVLQSPAPQVKARRESLKGFNFCMVLGVIGLKNSDLRKAMVFLRIRAAENI